MDQSPTTLLATDVVCLAPGDAIANPALRHTAACMRSLRPRIVECGDQYGDGTLLAVLMVIIADMAADHGVTDLIVDALHESATLAGPDYASRIGPG